MKAVLALPGYRRLLVVYALNELAWSVGNLALSLLVYRRTGSALASTGFFLASQFLPAFVAPNVVARVARHDARCVLALLYGLQAVVFGLLGAAPSHFALIPVLAVVLIGGSFGLTARPILRATTAALIAPAGLLREGNAVINIAFGLSILAGPLLGGALVLAAHSSVTVLISGAIFALLALGLALSRGLLAEVPERGSAPLQIRSALGRASRDVFVRRILLIQAVALVFFSLTAPVEVVLASHALHAGAAGYGALLSAWGAGAVLGSAIYARWHGLPAWLLIGLGAGLIGVGFLLMAVAPTIALANVGAAVGGIGNGIEAVAQRTALQERVGQRWMALTLSLNDSLSQTLPGLGFLLGGLLTQLAGVRLAFAVAGAGALSVGLLAPLVLRPAHRSAAALAALAASSRPSHSIEQPVVAED